MVGRPRAALYTRDFPLVEQLGDFPFVFPLLRKGGEDQADDIAFALRARDQHHAVGLDAFEFAGGEHLLGNAALVNKEPAKAVGRRGTLPITELEQAGLSREHFGR